jgi:hypothetical protein
MASRPARSARHVVRAALLPRPLEARA